MGLPPRGCFASALQYAMRPSVPVQPAGIAEALPPAANTGLDFNAFGPQAGASGPCAPNSIVPQSLLLPANLSHPSAGTSIESQERSLRDLFNTTVVPILDAATQLWPVPASAAEGGGDGGEEGRAAAQYRAFAAAAEAVQTRAFHMRAENFITGDVQVGQGNKGWATRLGG